MKNNSAKKILVAAAHDDGPSVISLNAKGDRLILRFRFDEDGSIRRRIKAVPGWMFDFKDTRLWSVPATKPNLDLVMGLLPQARIYIKDLERTKSLPQALAPRIAPAGQPRKAWAEDGQIRLFWDYNDRDFRDILAEVKECPGRRWNSDKKYWTAPPSLQLIALLENRQFMVAQDLREQLAKLTPKEGAKNILYFSLCPLYNEIKKHGGWENAKRSLCQESEQKTGRGNPKELQKGQGTGSAGQGPGDIDRKCPKSGMEKHGISSNQGSHAQTGSQGKTPEGPGASPGKARPKLQGRQRSGNDRHHQLPEQHPDKTGLHQGISREHQAGKGVLPECSDCIQNRLRGPGSHDRDRSGRLLPPRPRTKNQRCQEDQGFAGPWMDCPTLESLSQKDSIFNKLFDFQKDGVDFIESRHGRCLIGDSMGLGKTIQALAWLRMHPEARPAVIVVPASLKLNWRRECQKWCPGEPVIILSGRAGGKSQEFTNLAMQITEQAVGNRGNKAVIIVNYDILANSGKTKGWTEVLKAAMDIKAVVIDECHMIKNNKAQRTKAVRDLAKDVPHVIAMSGTPIINRPIEFYNAISLVNPAVFPSWYKFASRFCAPKFNGFGVEYTGASHTEELHHALTNDKTGIMIRRLKKDVLKDLPAKIRSVVPLELENRAEYERAADDFLNWLYEQERDKAKERLSEEGFVAPENIDRVAGRIGQTAMERASAAETLVAIGKLKQLAARGKLNSAISWIQNVVEQGEKIIVFAVHHWVIDRLMEEFKGQAVRLTGKENQEQRQAAVDVFQNDPRVQVFVGNVQAAGVGITLTAATHVAFVELPWTPGAVVQAEDRAHRIGQEQTVNVYYLVAEGTIEEDIAEMLDRKADVLGQVLDGKKANEESILGELLKKMKEKRDGQNIDN